MMFSPFCLISQIRIHCVPSASALLAVLGFAFCQSPGFSQSSASDARAAWGARADQIHNIDVRWTQTTTYVKGYGVSTKLDRDTTVSYPNERLVVAGERMRYESHMSNVRAFNEGWDPSRRLAAFDGSILTELITKNAECDYNRGRIESAQSHPDFDAFGVWPILFWAMPDAIGQLSDLQPLRKRAEVNGHEVELFRFHGVAGEVWLDPKRDFLPLQIVIKSGDVDQFLATIEYVAHPELKWAPRAWQIVEQNQFGGTFVLSSKATVDEIDYNVNIDDSVFAVAFPPVTVVHDKMQRTHYYIRKDGGVRPVSGNELAMGTSLTAAHLEDAGEAAPEHSDASTTVGGMSAGGESPTGDEVSIGKEPPTGTNAMSYGRAVPLLCFLILGCGALAWAGLRVKRTLA